MSADPLYVEARRVLLDALEALSAHGDAIIVAGAQAVYLRTGDAPPGVAEHTTDGDLALDPELLGNEPVLGVAMAESFSLKRDPGGAEEPGVWVQAVEIEGRTVPIQVDLIVPEGVAPPGGSRGARLPVHGNQAARKVPGMEAVLADYGPMAISALDAEDRRRITCNVAGPTGLLVAKAHKIADRLAEAGRRPDRVIDKDGGDVYRLMQSTPVEDVRATATRLLNQPRVAVATRRGLGLLRSQFGARRAPGVEMAVQTLRLGVPEERVRAVCTGFVSALADLVDGD